MSNYNNIGRLIFLLLVTVSAGCKKMIGIPPPVSSITTETVFNSDVEAKAAMAGVYTLMINGNSSQINQYSNGFSEGLSTVFLGLTSDELLAYSSTNIYQSNKVTIKGDDYGNTCWSSAYSTIYACNSIIDGIAASSSKGLHDSLRVEYTAESKFIRAFCYFYLVNLFGDIPLVLTSDFNQNTTLSRTPVSLIYQQIVSDLKDARQNLREDYLYGNGEHIVANKYAATAMLARVYLYLGQYQDAETEASTVINSGKYSMNTPLNAVFLKNSAESIWQLQQYVNESSTGNAVPEALAFIPSSNPNTGMPSRILSSQLLGSFEAGDNRRTTWVDSTNNSLFGQGNGTFYYYPFKYKTGYYNYQIGGVASEYYMVLRLAELYLVRAEAEANGAGGGSAAAIADVNVIRNRAGLTSVSAGISADSLMNEIVHQRQDEFFCEWGQRWFDLIRLKLAHDVLSGIPVKQPWSGDFQLLFPIPGQEIQYDHNLTQNPGYTN